MLEGTVTAKNLVDSLISEIDVSLPKIQRTQYYEWINAELFRIYSSYIKCIGANMYTATKCAIDLNKPCVPENWDFDIWFDTGPPPERELVNCTEKIDKITFEDVYKVFGPADDEYIKGTYSSIFPESGLFYYKNNGKLHVNYVKATGEFKILFFMRPARITEENADTYIIPIPDGYLDIIRSAIRREVFLLSGEIAMSNAWGQYHDALLEEMRRWHSEKEEVFVK